MEAIVLEAPPRFDQEHGRQLLESVKDREIGEGTQIRLNFSATREIDSLGGAWLVAIADHVRRKNGRLSCEGGNQQVAEFLDMITPGLTTPAEQPAQPQGFFEEIGDKALSWKGEAREFFDLIIDGIYWTLLAPFEGRGFRWGLFFDEAYEMGVRAVRIVCLMNFLLGLIIAMLSAKQVEGFGIQIYVADLIVIAFARELAAIMTAVVVSARTGAAIAAELATMKVQEEIDALRGMGLNVSQFLVAPKLLALVVVLPCLVTLGFLSGVAGGGAWGVFVLGFEPSVWFRETANALDFNDILQGFLKTLVFAVAIVLIGCHNGLRVQGGSRGVGLMTTRAVVMDIFMIIVIDIVFATIFYYLLD